MGCRVQARQLPSWHSWRAVAHAEPIAARRPQQAVEVALHQVATSLCDLGLALLAQGKLEAGLKRMEQGLNLCPSSQVAFHNLVATLLKHRLLRAGNLDAMAQFVSAQRDKLPWVRQYENVLFAPRFLNVEFVSGKCNLKCRMCRGAHSPAYPNKLSYLSADDFDQMLAAAPTICGVTLSSGNSDPLLHPEIERIVEVAAAHQVQLDLYTNGHPLSARLCRKIVDSQAFNVINFSIDAVTPETYRRIRGASLERVIRKIEMLQAMKAEKNLRRPGLSLSFVAMADNIEELPAFVRLALRLGAGRVFVEHLNGWEDGDGGNYIPTDNPRCLEYVEEARGIAAGTGLELTLPEQFLREPSVQPTGGTQRGACQESESAKPPSGATRLIATKPEESTPAESVPLPSQDEPSAGADSSAAGGRLPCCGWLRGVWVHEDGRLDPCCMVRRVADLGNIHDGPLMQNEKYLKVKSLLLTGKVFEDCLNARLCQYVQQRKAAGQRLEIITRQELGDLHPDAAAAIQTQTTSGTDHERQDQLQVLSTSS